MAEHLQRSQSAIEEIQRLREELAEVKKELSTLKECGGDQGWMALKKASGIIGISSEALAQRFRRGVYPEGVVWYQAGDPERAKRPYMVNLQALREHMARGKH